MSTVDRLLKGIGNQPQRPKDPFFDRYGLLGNPFPTSRTIIPEILFNQEKAVEQFIDAVVETAERQPNRRALALVGGTGNGKTHFLRHCQHSLQAMRKQTGKRFATVEFAAGSGPFQTALKEVYVAADAACQSGNELDFLTALIRILRDRPGDTAAQLRQPDLKRLMERLKETSNSTDFDLLRDAAQRWLTGGSLTQVEMHRLGVTTRLNTPAMATRIICEVFGLARSLDILEGVLFCVDELESLFRSGRRPAYIQSFLQDFRFFYDEAVRNGTGFSLIVLVGSTTTGATELRDYNFPLYQRLGFEENLRITLHPIRGFSEFRNFADLYIRHAHEQWIEQGHRNPEVLPESLLSLGELEDVYRTAEAPASSPEGPLLIAMRKHTHSQATGAVNQAPLLDALHRFVEEKRRHSMRR